jgi:hypothetical protein
VKVLGNSLSKSLSIYPDGIRIGCTFVSREAVRFIVDHIRHVDGWQGVV